MKKKRLKGAEKAIPADAEICKKRLKKSLSGHLLASFGFVNIKRMLQQGGGKIAIGHLSYLRKTYFESCVCQKK
ncbi:MAG: hypothetical protein IJB46_02000 [Prevotella sp.]|nr:hypothetical protein [Prevotella sp.]